LIDSKISLAASARFGFTRGVAFCPELFACLLRGKSPQLKANIMKSAWIVWTALLVLGAALEAQQKYSGGIVYGPKAAFNISAPQGWVLDNESGVEQGQPCVLYPKGESWADARTVMYAKIASTEFEDVNAFVAWAIKGMIQKHGKPKEKIASGKTHDGHPYFINEYPATKNYSQWERVGYIQLPHAAAYIVLSSRDHASYQKDSGALEKVLKTLVYIEPKFENKPE
jgi:hypothetical protein